jgi:chromosome segregation ATPase
MSARALAELETAVSSDEFHDLEEKVFKTIELLKSAREAKAIAERDVSRLRMQLEEREEEAETLREQMVNLRREREEVRGRVEKMLKQIDAIETDGAQA